MSRPCFFVPLPSSDDDGGDRERFSVTAGNTSGLSDGAAVLLLMSDEAVAKYGLRPKATVLSCSDASLDPNDFLVAPAVAMKNALHGCGMDFCDVDFFEINEAFGVAPLAILSTLFPDDEDAQKECLSRCNKRGGAISIGHPLGASGARIVGSLTMSLDEAGQVGMASMCNGGGGASAIIISYPCRQ